MQPIDLCQFDEALYAKLLIIGLTIVLLVLPELLPEWHTNENAIKTKTGSYLPIV